MADNKKDVVFKIVIDGLDEANSQLQGFMKSFDNQSVSSGGGPMGGAAAGGGAGNAYDTQTSSPIFGNSDPTGSVIGTGGVYSLLGSSGMQKMNSIFGSLNPPSSVSVPIGAEHTGFTSPSGAVNPLWTATYSNPLTGQPGYGGGLSSQSPGGASSILSNLQVSNLTVTAQNVVINAQNVSGGGFGGGGGAAGGGGYSGGSYSVPMGAPVSAAQSYSAASSAGMPFMTGGAQGMPFMTSGGVGMPFMTGGAQSMPFMTGGAQGMPFMTGGASPSATPFMVGNGGVGGAMGWMPYATGLLDTAQAAGNWYMANQMLQFPTEAAQRQMMARGGLGTLSALLSGAAGVGVGALTGSPMVGAAVAGLGNSLLNGAFSPFVRMLGVHSSLESSEVFQQYVSGNMNNANEINLLGNSGLKESEIATLMQTGAGANAMSWNIAGSADNGYTGYRELLNLTKNALTPSGSPALVGKMLTSEMRLQRIFPQSLGTNMSKWLQESGYTDWRIPSVTYRNYKPGDLMGGSPTPMVTMGPQTYGDQNVHDLINSLAMMESSQGDFIGDEDLLLKNSPNQGAFMNMGAATWRRRRMTEAEASMFGSEAESYYQQSKIYESIGMAPSDIFAARMKMTGPMEEQYQSAESLAAMMRSTLNSQSSPVQKAYALQLEANARKISSVMGQVRQGAQSKYYGTLEGMQSSYIQQLQSQRYLTERDPNNPNPVASALAISSQIAAAKEATSFLAGDAASTVGMPRDWLAAQAAIRQQAMASEYQTIHGQYEYLWNIQESSIGAGMGLTAGQYSMSKRFGGPSQITHNAAEMLGYSSMMVGQKQYELSNASNAYVSPSERLQMEQQYGQSLSSYAQSTDVYRGSLQLNVSVADLGRQIVSAIQQAAYTSGVGGAKGAQLAATTYQATKFESTQASGMLQYYQGLVDSGQMASDNPDYLHARAQYASSLQSVAQSQLGLADVPFSSSSKERLAQAGYEASILSSVPGTYGNIQAAISRHMAGLGSQYGQLQSQWTSMVQQMHGQPNDAQILEIHNRERGLGSQWVSDLMQLSYGWQGRLMSTAVNLPGNFSMASPYMAYRAAVGYGIHNPFFGSTGAMLPQWLSGAGLVSSIAGSTGTPEGFAATAMTGVHPNNVFGGIAGMPFGALGPSQAGNGGVTTVQLSGPVQITGKIDTQGNLTGTMAPAINTANYNDTGNGGVAETLNQMGLIFAGANR